MTKRFCDWCKKEVETGAKLNSLCAGVVRPRSFPVGSYGAAIYTTYPQAQPEQPGFEKVADHDPVAIELCDGCVPHVARKVREFLDSGGPVTPVPA